MCNEISSLHTHSSFEASICLPNLSTKYSESSELSEEVLALLYAHIWSFWDVYNWSSSLILLSSQQKAQYLVDISLEIKCLQAKSFSFISIIFLLLCLNAAWDEEIPELPISIAAKNSAVTSGAKQTLTHLWS